jgi:asparagine synthase (glutamine-hydrolysing)
MCIALASLSNMCGIAVVLSRDGSPIDVASLERMANVLAHRGPDDSGVLTSGPVGLGFRRLSILDLSPAGHQPMASEDGQATVVFNGEIYNFLELRKELEGLGHRFRSTGDTEVLLRAYLQWGRDCLARLNGMWAFAIHDKRRGVVFASRDRFGMKPLYRCSTKGHLLLASEIKSIRASGLVKDAINWRTAASFLLENRLDETNETFYEGIEHVPPGTAFEIELGGGQKEWRYWSLEAPGNSPADAPAKFADLFEDSVRLHMRSDVPVGVDLSGGLDSTSIICATARVRREQGATEPLLAFCYQAPEFDESSYISDTLRQTGAKLVSLKTSARSLWDDLTRTLWYQDEPVHSMTAVIGYQLMRLAAQHGVKVILNGQGADETIGGYDSYFRDYWYTLVRGGRLRDAWSQVGEYARSHRGSRPRLVQRLARHLVQTELRSLGLYRAMSHSARVRRLRANSWFEESLREQLPLDQANGELDLMSTLRHGVTVSPLPLYLRVEDRNSMAHSVEARLPFLDYRIVSLLFNLKPEWHLRGPWNKFVLRESMRGRIPESVRSRVDKMGFPHPARRWFGNELREPVLDILHSRPTRERGIYNTKAILRDVERHRQGEVDVASRLFKVAEFETWSGVSRVSGGLSSH